MHPYNKCDMQSIYQYAKKLQGKTFRQVIEEGNKYYNSLSVVEETSVDYFTGVKASYENKNRKGGLGEVIEEYYFFYEPDNRAEADFPEAGLELKVTPYKKNKNSTISAKERLVICMIDYHQIVKETFYKSHLWSKLENILLIYYLWEEHIENRLDYRIDFIYLLQITGEDLSIIKEDFLTIKKKVIRGEAHLLSEADTLYLGAVTKSSSSKNRTSQPYSLERAKPRAFSLKTTYMTYVLRTYIEPEYEGKRKAKRLDKIFKNSELTNFEAEVKSIIDSYSNTRSSDLFNEFLGHEDIQSKNQFNQLILRMLGVYTSNAEEFEKANISIKTIRVDKNGKLPEHMSFPAFSIKKLVNEKWEESELRQMFEETKFFFIVFQETDNDYILKGSTFWNMDVNVLDTTVYSEWLAAQTIFKKGVSFKIKHSDKGGYRIYNNLPKASETEIIHVRPHTNRSYYQLSGVEYGAGKKHVDGDELPNGDYMTKQSFWINKTYIASIIKKILIEH